MSKLYIGIDPGKSCALAFIYENKVIDIWIVPLAGNDLDIPLIYGKIFINGLNKSGQAVACIEKVHAMPGQGVVSMFKFGFVTGVLHGIIGSLGIPLHLITPQAWKKEILVGTAKDKNSAIEFCRRVYPSVSLLATPKSRVCHSGMADALCIARYASLKY